MRSLEAFGAGCAFLDYNGDGFQDILLVSERGCALYRNAAGARFEDVTQATGLAAEKGRWMGCAAGDYDGDGLVDLLLTGYHRLSLLHNEGGKRWRNVTAQVGLDGLNRNHWGSSAGFMDLDANGTLDLVLLNYVVFGPKTKQYCEFRPGVRSGCPPSTYEPEFAELWKNVGPGKFRDVTASAGLRDTHGKALVVAFADVDDDGRIDFYIGNDGTQSELMRNLGGLKFRNIGEASGAGFGAVPGHTIAAMGADWSDYDRDGRLDLAVSAFSDEPYSLLHNAGASLLEHRGDETGLTGATFKPLGFGAKWLDVDNDGWPDLMFANGHVYDNTDEIDPLTTLRQPLMLFRNEAGEALRDLVPVLGGELTTPILGRGLATGDFDNDGRMDVLAVDYEGAPLLLHNLSDTPNHWITLDLRGRGGNRLAYGARVTLVAGEKRWKSQVSPASSYLSSSDPRVHVGLGEASTLDSITIQWPSGGKSTLRNVKADQVLRVDEAAAITGG